MDGGKAFIELRDRLLGEAVAQAQVMPALDWPAPRHFNWALDYFDRIATGNEGAALRVVDDAGRDVCLSFAELARRSNQAANFLAAQGVGSKDRVLIMLGNVVALWEVMLAVIKLGAVMIPATTLLQRADLEDRLTRGRVRAIVTDRALTGQFAGLSGAPIRISVGGPAAGWCEFERSTVEKTSFKAGAPTPADALMLLYFTSGTTAKPKLVAHSHTSYAVGHLSTAYWIGLRRGDVHLNLSSPGWAKHAWSSFFAPWNAEATVLAYHYERFSATALLDQLVRCGVTTFCAPPTVWRMLIQEDLRRWPVALREVVGAGEPLNPEVISQVKSAWGLTIRDGFGQTETTAQIGNPPGQPVKPGSMGRPLPGYEVALVAADGSVGEEGEICLDLRQRPVGLMQAYLDDPEKTAEVMRDGYYPPLCRSSGLRRGGLPDLRGAPRRRVQVVGLSDQSVRAGECADRASRGGGSGGGAEPGRAAIVRAESVRGVGGGRGGRCGNGARHPGLRAWAGVAVQTHSAPGVCGAAENHFGQDPAGGAAPGGE